MRLHWLRSCKIYVYPCCFSIMFFILDANRQPPIHPPAKCRQVALHHTQWDSLVLQSYLSCHPGGYDCIPGKVAPLQIPCCSDLPATSLVNFHDGSFRWCEKRFLSKSSTQNNITRPPLVQVMIKWYQMISNGATPFIYLSQEPKSLGEC